MTNNPNEKYIKLWTPATYRIEVQGQLDESWSDRLVGMRITTSSQGDQGVVTTLVGRLRDQAELMGVFDTLYNLHLSILSVEMLEGEQQKMGSEEKKAEIKSGEQQP
jgi:hypothetical protein